MFIAALFQEQRPGTKDLVIDYTRKIRHIYTIDYYAAIKNEEFVSFIGTRMNLETIILSKLF